MKKPVSMDCSGRLELQLQLEDHQATDTSYLGVISDVAQEDVAGLIEAQKHYGNSWKKRGGIGAAMMLLRKVDRFELQISKHGYDVFTAAAADRRQEGIIDDIRDLRRYLMLVEAEIRCRNAASKTVDLTEPEAP